ncbi:MAG: elongation factor 1-beta [Candidatus Aenigmarchaeota archaeon]|nr:elongation factor 1-beta [Candidatus Aenigmarchaeota archaeon]
MTDVIVSFKVMPRDTDVNLDDLENKIKSSISPERMERHPIAFGIVAIHVTKLVPDEGGGLVDKIEDKLRAIPEVGEIEVIEVTRSL